MNYINNITSAISIFINSVVLIKCYGKISDKTIPIKKLKNILLFLTYMLLIYLCNLLMPISYKWIFVFFIIMIFNKVFYKETNFLTVFKTIVVYLILLMIDFAISIFLTQIPAILELMEKNLSMIKTIDTIVVSILIYLFFSVKPLIRKLDKLCKYINNKKKIIYIALALLSFISFYSIEYYHGKIGTIESFSLSLILIVFFAILCFVLIYQYFKNIQIEENQKTLLYLMNEYEAILDKDRINRHEILNNLLVLKSYNNKGSKEYENVLDSIIDEYQRKKTKNYANLYKLPSGIKGIVYYKIANITDNNIEFNTVISKESVKTIEKLDSKLYFNVCKIIGILLDNAIEACNDCIEKQILLDIYTEENDNYIYIENTFNGKIDLTQINKKGFSTKGKGRGLGLHIINKIVKDNKEIEIKQYINNSKFVSLLKIKNPE